MIFHWHEYIAKIIDSDDFCSSQSFMEAISWILPKLREDCNLIATTLRWHPYRDVVIVLDLWLFFVLVVSTVGGIYLYVRMCRYRLQDLNRWRKALSVILPLVMLCISSIYLFASTLYTLGVKHPETLAMFGFSAVAQTFFSSMSYFTSAVCYQGALRENKNGVANDER